MTHVPVLETDRLRLREFRASDHAAFADFVGDPGAAHFLGGACDAVTAWRRMAAFAGHWPLRGFGPFAIASRETDEFLGYCGPWFPYGKPEREIMWGVIPAAQRRGIASEAAHAARQWTYENCGWPMAVSYIAPENIASRRVAEKLGAAHDGNVDYRGYVMQVWRHPPSETLNQKSQ
ncbi:MAG: GNAT family N-acetyltransferase [Pseudomonadota bacterium]